MTDEQLETQILTTLSSFADVSATEEDIRAAIHLQAEIEVREALLGLLYQHKIKALWNSEKEPTFVNA